MLVSQTPLKLPWHPMKAKPITACRAEGKRPFSRPRPWLFKLASAAFALLLFKVFVFILIEYPRYFPPDFESNYLAGRRYSFVGEFRIAFYVHILSSPIALMMGLGLMLSGTTSKLSWRELAKKCTAKDEKVFFGCHPFPLVFHRQSFCQLSPTSTVTEPHRPPIYIVTSTRDPFNLFC